MSGVAIVQHLLANYAGLTAVVSAGRILSGVLPLGTVLPAISVQEVSSVERNTVGMNASQVLVTDRVQVTVHASNYQMQKSILALVRAACPVSRGTVNGFACEAVLPDLRGPDMYDAEVPLYMQTQDFIVKFNR